MKIQKITLPALVLACMAWGCSPSPESKSNAEPQAEALSVPPPPPVEGSGQEKPLAAQDRLSEEAARILKQTMAGLKLKKSGEIKSKAEDVPKTVTAIEEIAAREGGYIIASEINTAVVESRPDTRDVDTLTDVVTKRQEATVVLAVPVDKFEALMAGLNTVGWKIEKREIHQIDVGLTLQTTAQAAADKREDAALSERRAARQGPGKAAKDLIGQEYDKADAARNAARRERDDLLQLNRDLTWSIVNLTISSPLITEAARRINPQALAARVHSSGSHMPAMSWVTYVSFALNALLLYLLSRKQKMAEEA